MKYIKLINYTSIINNNDSIYLNTIRKFIQIIIKIKKDIYSIFTYPSKLKK